MTDPTTDPDGTQGADSAPPDWRPCPSDDCSNGCTLAAAWVGAVAGLLLMLAEGTAHNGRPLHPWLDALPCRPDCRPGPQILDLTAGLAGRPPGDLGHDAIDQAHAVRKIVAAAGLAEDWEICPVCQGSAIHPDDRPAYDAHLAGI